MKRTLFSVLMAATLVAFISCGSTKVENVKEEPAAPADSAAKVAAMAEEGAIDLSTWETMDKFAVKYDAEAYTITMNGNEYIQFPLAQPLEAGKTITVHITGVNNGKSGFRSWVVDNNQTTNSDPLYMDSAFDGLAAGDFDITYTLNATAESYYLFIKGPQWGTMLDNIILKSVAVVFN